MLSVPLLRYPVADSGEELGQMAIFAMISKSQMIEMSPLVMTGFPVTTPSTKDGTTFMHKFALVTLSVHCEPLSGN